jgi:flagellar biosynthesis protein FlhG
MSTTTLTTSPGSEPTATGRTERPRVFAITSGKGGVGKTMLAANLAAALARRGERVLVIDADLGLANLDVVLNLQPRRTLHDVFTGQGTLDQALLTAPGDFQVLLAGSGLIEYSRLTPTVREQFARLIDTVRPHYDRVLIDTGAGISDVVLYAISMADEAIVIATPEPTALADAYATVKVLGMQQGRTSMMLVVNQTHRHGEGRHVAAQLQSVIDRFITLPEGGTIRLNPLGEVGAPGGAAAPAGDARLSGLRRRPGHVGDRDASGHAAPASRPPADARGHPGDAAAGSRAGRHAGRVGARPLRRSARRGRPGRCHRHRRSALIPRTPCRHALGYSAPA